MLVGGTHPQLSALGRWWCRPPPYLTEPFLVSPASVGGVHRQSFERGWRCWPPPHLVEPFSDSPMMVGGGHWQSSVPRRGGASRLHTSWSCSLTCPCQWEVRIDSYLRLDWRCRPPLGVGPATQGAAVGLACDGGRGVLQTSTPRRRGCQTPTPVPSLARGGGSSQPST